MAGAKGTEGSSDRLLRLLEAPPDGGKELLDRLDAIHSETGRAVHSELLKLLTHVTCPNGVARQIWAGYQVHRATLKRRLGRDVGPRVALFDYLLNVDRRLSNPKIIEISDYERTERSAMTDHLTGLFNRAHFDGALRREVNRCRRYGQTASLVVLDLDDFKAVNDILGHPAGDAVLKDVGHLLSQRVRDIDIAARYGGEEFGIILPETSRIKAYVVAERIRSELERFFRRKIVDRKPVNLTLSGGIAGFPEDADSPESLLARADEALYRAKRSGKNRVDVYFTEKRKAGRVNIEPRGIRVTVNGGPESTPTPGRALNISEGGILIETQGPIRLGQALRISLPVGEDPDLTIDGEVVRLEEKKAGGRRRLFDAGVRFIFGARSLPRELSRFIRESAAASA